MISILHVDLKIPAEVDKSEKKVEEEEEKFVMKLKFYRKNAFTLCLYWRDVRLDRVI